MQNQIALKNQWGEESTLLMDSIVRLGSRSQAVAIQAKKDLSLAVSDLMIQGVPKYREVMKRTPMFLMLRSDNEKKEVRKELHTTLFHLIKEFCDSLNLIRPMNEFQMVDAATFLIEECHNFRIEDYVLMFTMAKRGKLVKIMDRMDVQIIGVMVQEYSLYREKLIDDIEIEEHRQRIKDSQFIPKPVTPEEIEASNRFGELLQALRDSEEYTREGLGTRAMHELEKKGFDVTNRKRVMDRLAARQLEKLEQIKFYKPGLKISWISNRMDKNHRLYGIDCRGKIEDVRGDVLWVTGIDSNGKQVEDSVSIKDLTIKILKKDDDTRNSRQ